MQMRGTGLSKQVRQTRMAVERTVTRRRKVRADAGTDAGGRREEAAKGKRPKICISFSTAAVLNEGASVETCTRQRFAFLPQQRDPRIQGARRESVRQRRSVGGKELEARVERRRRMWSSRGERGRKETLD